MEKEDDKEKKQKVLFVSQDYVLPFRPFELNHNYSVLYTIEKEGTIQTLEQNFNVRRLKPDTEQTDYHFIEINKISELLLNGEPVDARAYTVAQKTAELLYPLRLVVNKYGKWIDINSYYKLKERWEKQKEDIRELFEGKVFERLVRNLEETIHDDAALVRLVSGNWFLRTYFNGIHRAYTENLETERTVFFPAIAQADELEFSIVQKVNPYLNDLNLIEVTQIGEPKDEYLEGNYRAEYFLNPNNYIIQEAEMECNLEMSIPRKIGVKIQNLDKNEIMVDSGISLLI